LRVSTCGGSAEERNPVVLVIFSLFEGVV